MHTRWPLALLAALALISVSAVTSAQTPPQAKGVPPAPSNVQVLGGVLTWVDNAHNEDGYRITVELHSDLTDEVTILEFEVGPDVESFPLPEKAQPRCPDRTSVWYEVVAFNEAGSSQARSIAIMGICPGTGEPTATPEVVLPKTGTGEASSSGGMSWLAIVLVIAGLAAMAGAGALRMGVRRR